MCTVEINISENQNGNQERTIQRNWVTLGTKDTETKTSKAKNPKHKILNTYN